MTGPVCTEFTRFAHNIWETGIRFETFTKAMGAQRNHLTGRFQMPLVRRHSLPGWAKWLLGAIMLWCVFQAAFLVAAFSGGPPSPTAELLSTHNDLYYRASLGFHIFGFLAVGSVWIAASSAQRGLRTLMIVVVSIVAITLATVFFASKRQANYHIYFDLQEEQFIRRDIHLLPPGIKSSVISFREAQTANNVPTEPTITPLP